MVADSYFDKERPNAIILYRTDDIKAGYPRVLICPHDPATLYVKDETTAYVFSWNPMRKPVDGQWPLSSIDKIEGLAEVTLAVKDLLVPEQSEFWDEDCPTDAWEDTTNDIETEIEQLEDSISKFGETYSSH